MHSFAGFFCLTETWLNESVLDNEIIPRGKDRARRGGVLVAVKDNFSSWIIPSPIELEVVSVAIQLEDVVCTRICTVYIPPNASLCYVQSLCSYLSKLSADFETLGCSW